MLARPIIITVENILALCLLRITRNRHLSELDLLHELAAKITSNHIIGISITEHKDVMIFKFIVDARST